MLKKSFLVVLLVCVLSLVGCETYKGAKKDYENAQKLDQEMRDELW